VEEVRSRVDGGEGEVVEGTEMMGIEPIAEGEAEKGIAGSEEVVMQGGRGRGRRRWGG